MPTSTGGIVSEALEIVATRDFLDELSATRAAVFRLLKNEGYASIPRIAEVLGISHEAARKQVADLQRNGWIASDCPPDEAERNASMPGRPAVRYCLTEAGDHFFPKQYPDFSIWLLDTIAAGGDEALTAALTRMTDERVAELKPHVEPLPLERKMDVLRTIYADEDPFTDVQRRGDDYVLVERNCPYLAVAMERMSICSTTVSALRRLTQCEVVRERRFQDGDGRCEFHVKSAQQSPAREQPPFEREPPKTA